MSDRKQLVLLPLFLVALVVVFVAINHGAPSAPAPPRSRCVKVPHRAVEMIAQMVVPHRHVYGIAAVESRADTGFTIPGFNRARFYFVRVNITPRPGAAIFAVDHSVFTTGLGGVVLPVDAPARAATDGLPVDLGHVGISDYTDGYQEVKSCR